jgi:hypothetical protein
MKVIHRKRAMEREINSRNIGCQGHSHSHWSFLGICTVFPTTGRQSLDAINAEGSDIQFQHMGQEFLNIVATNCRYLL